MRTSWVILQLMILFSFSMLLACPSFGETKTEIYQGVESWTAGALASFGCQLRLIRGEDSILGFQPSTPPRAFFRETQSPIMMTVGADAYFQSQITVGADTILIRFRRVEEKLVPFEYEYYREAKPVRDVYCKYLSLVK